MRDLVSNFPDTPDSSDKRELLDSLTQHTLRRLVLFALAQALFLAVVLLVSLTVAPQGRTPGLSDWGTALSLLGLQFVALAIFWTCRKRDQTSFLLIQQLRQAREDLLKSTQERESLQEQLVQSQKMESLGRLAGGVSHDFNNLLTVALGNLEMARIAPGGPAEMVSQLRQAELASLRAAEVTGQQLHDAELAALRAAEVKGQLLAFSSRQAPAMEPVDLAALIRDSVKLMRRLLGEHIVIEVDLAPEVVVIADHAQLCQVMLNFAVNAAAAMPMGGRLNITLTSDSGWASIRARDNRTRVDADLTARIYEPFFTTTGMGDGSDLGLSTVLGIISQHQGQIEVESPVGQGAAFVVRLPLAESATQESDANPQSRTLPVLGSGTILLVEDDEHVRNLAAQVLRSSGYQVRTAENGEIALQMARSTPEHIDLLLTDVVMPGLDGGQLAAYLRDLQPNLPVLFMSGYTDDRLSCFGIHGESNFLDKPFSLAQLAHAVQGTITAHKTKSPV